MFNIGLEGLMLFGAVCATIGFSMTASPVLGLGSGMLGGAGAAAILSLGIVMARANQVVVGIGFNLLALGLTSLLRQLFLTEAQTGSVRSVSSMRVPGLSDLPIVGRAFFSQSPVFYAAIAVALLLWVVFRYMRLGLVLRGVGENASAADASGIPVLLLRTGAVVFTGLMAGLGGGYLCIVASGGVFVDHMTAGRGYLAIAIVIFARWHPMRSVIIAFVLGCLEALQFQGQYLGLDIDPPLLLATPFVIALVAWVLLGKTNAAPRDLGVPFFRGS